MVTAYSPCSEGLRNSKSGCMEGSLFIYTYACFGKKNDIGLQSPILGDSLQQAVTLIVMATSHLSKFHVLEKQNQFFSPEL